MHSPQLLILDEPSDGVDPVGRRDIREILSALEEQGVTIFINSHLLVEVELFCKEVAILHHGKVAVTGRVRDLTAGKGYRLSAAQVPEQLFEELKLRATDASVNNGLSDFHFPTREAVNDAVDRLRAEKCAIEALVPTTSTLEEVFVKTVES